MKSNTKGRRIISQNISAPKNRGTYSAKNDVNDPPLNKMIRRRQY